MDKSTIMFIWDFAIELITKSIQICKLFAILIAPLLSIFNLRDRNRECVCVCVIQIDFCYSNSEASSTIAKTA